jgi:RimJ/RimL family protein N-acetyltransferase
VAARAVALLVEDLRDHGEGRRFLLAFPAVSNLASNAVCRRAGFAMTGTERETFRGAELELNEWALDLAPGT